MCGFLGLAGGSFPQKMTVDFFVALAKLQHRGQGSAGGAFSDGTKVNVHKDIGLVPVVFTPEVLKMIESWNPAMAIGHTRYPTSGDGSSINAQPHWLHDRRGKYAFCANGDVPDLDELQKKWSKETGMVFESMNDSEFNLKVIDFFIDTEKPDWKTEYIHGIRRMMETIRATYSGGLITGSRMYIFRDPHENRPLYYGRRGDGMFVAASETAVLDGLGTNVIGEVRGGEIIVVRPDGTYKSVEGVPKKEKQFCIFEAIYFSRPDSIVLLDKTGAYFRRLLGIASANNELEVFGKYCEADCVISVPSSGDYFADGYSQQRGLLMRHGFLKDPYVGRTFISSGQDLRREKAMRKYNVLNDVPSGIYDMNGKALIPSMKRVVVCDDSIVRLTTMKVLVDKLQAAGYEEIHIRISAPPIVEPCFFGIDMKTHDQLIAAQRTEEQIREELGVNSLQYLPLKWLDKVIIECGGRPEDYCRKCFGAKCAI